MARRKAKRRRRSSGGFSRMRRSKRGSVRSKAGKTMPYVAAALYGAGRQKLAELVAPVAAKIPAGNIADEVAMFGANWAIKKFVGGKVPVLGQAAKTGMLIEAANIGAVIAAGQLNMGGQQQTASAGFGATLG